jgi:hypothetical protein
MKHIVVLTEAEDSLKDTRVHKFVVIETPPLILLWRGMFFSLVQTRKFSTFTQYKYTEVDGWSLTSLCTSENVDDDVEYAKETGEFRSVQDGR